MSPAHLARPQQTLWTSVPAPLDPTLRWSACHRPLAVPCQLLQGTCDKDPKSTPCLSENTRIPHGWMDKGAWPAGSSKWWMAWTSPVEGGSGSVRWQLCSPMRHTEWCARWAMPEWCLWECQRHREALGRVRAEEEGDKGAEPRPLPRPENKEKKSRKQRKKRRGMIQERGRGTWKHSPSRSDSG